MKAPRPLSRFAISATVPRCGSTFSMSLRKATACVIDPKREIVAPLLIPCKQAVLGVGAGTEEGQKGVSVCSLPFARTTTSLCAASSTYCC
jgi:hypothetical protein